ncbi:hypothetical protein TNCV_3751941, partial [Trichonephila clavipes]
MLFPTHRCLDDQQETSESQMNCSLMMSPERRRTKQAIRTTRNFRFHEDRQVDSREDECETQDFLLVIMLQSTNEPTVSPTERRIIHEEVQKMLDEGNFSVQPSEKSLVITHCARKKKKTEAGLKLNSKKCLFAAQEVKILGHLVSSNGVRPDPDKIKA